MVLYLEDLNKNSNVVPFFILMIILTNCFSTIMENLVRIESGRATVKNILSQTSINFNYFFATKRGNIIKEDY